MWRLRGGKTVALNRGGLSEGEEGNPKAGGKKKRKKAGGALGGTPPGKNTPTRENEERVRLE